MPNAFWPSRNPGFDLGDDASQRMLDAASIANVPDGVYFDNHCP